MGVETQRYIRKPLYVQAVRVTPENFDELVKWCQGEVETKINSTRKNKKYIKVRVHHPKNPRQTQAFVGDWILYTDRGYKVYTNDAFNLAFDLADEVEAKEYPYEEGNVIVLGPEIFAAAVEGRRVISWKGENFVPQEQPDQNYEEIERVTADVPGEPDRNEEAKYEESAPNYEEIERATAAPEPEVVEESPLASTVAAIDEHTTPQGEPHEYVQATPQAIADVVAEQQPVEFDGGTPESEGRDNSDNPVGAAKEPMPEGAGPGGTEFGDTPIAPPPTPAIIPPEVAPQPEPVSEQPPEIAAAGKMVISLEEQQQLGPEGVRELLASGEAILAQDLAESA
jgi:hypothetical protein